MEWGSRIRHVRLCKTVAVKFIYQGNTYLLCHSHDSGIDIDIRDETRNVECEWGGIITKRAVKSCELQASARGQHYVCPMPVYVCIDEACICEKSAQRCTSVGASISGLTNGSDSNQKYMLVT